MVIQLVVAVGEGGVIGKEGGLPWPRNRDDMAWFRELTSGGAVIMGRGTWESIGSKPLPHRVNVVLSSSTLPIGALWARTPEEVLRLCTWIPKISIIGGAEVYFQFLGVADKIWVSVIHGDHWEGDRFFEVPDEGWEGHLVDEGEGVSFFLYTRQPSTR